MRIKGTVVLFLALICLPLPLYAVDMNGASRTYFQARESFDDETYLPLLEYLDFSLDDFSGEEYSFHFGGWARRDLNHEKSFDQRSSNLDLQYAYLNYHRDEADALVNVGRVPVYEGVASESVDGFYARSDLLHGFGIAAYGGIPVETDFDKRGGDLIYGTRISREKAGLYRVGLSYLKEKNDGDDFRTETGLDLRVRPHEQVEFFGRSIFNGETSGWMEHAYSVTYLPREDLRIIGELDAVHYKDYFGNVDTHTTGIFDLNIGVLDPDEELLELGFRGEYKIREDLTVTGLFRNYNYSVADSADYYGAGFTYRPTEEMGGGCSLYRMDGQSDTRRYYELRLYAYKKYDKADVTVDLFNVHYDASINGESNGFSASLAGGYALSENGRISADVEYASNPTFRTDIRLFVKYLYNFNVSPLKVPDLKAPELHLPHWKIPTLRKRAATEGADKTGSSDSQKEKKE